MKKIRFDTIQLIMIGMILFGIVAIFSLIISSKIGLLFVVFLALATLIYLLYYQKITYEWNEIEQIERLNDETEVSLKNLLDTMPVGVIKFHPETYAVEWFNPYAQLIFSDDDGKFNSQSISRLIKSKRANTSNQRIRVGKNYYLTNLDESSGLFYFFDSTVDAKVSTQLRFARPVIGIISIDNYDDLTEELSDAEVSQINSFIANFISSFSKSKDIFYRRVNMDRFYFFTSYGVLDDLINGKFALIEQFRNASQEQNLPLTLSIGVSYGDHQHDTIGRVALENLNMALVRGGDQAVVKEVGEHKELLYFGGGTVSTVKRSRTRTRAMMTAISDRIRSVDSVFIVGHRNLDMDALGSAVGMDFFASNIIDKVYTVYNPNELTSDIRKALGRLMADAKSHLITVEDAMSKVTKESLLIMVDHSKIQLTLSEEFYRKFTQVIVVDHHRRDKDFPSQAVLTFIESGASSASELVTELIQFQNAHTNKLSKVQASVLMAGIMLDTKNFTTRVTSRTFDVASYLRANGSDSVEIQNISAVDFEEYRSINELILQGERIVPNIIVASGPDDKVYTNVIASKAADTMLEMSGIEASFVLTRNNRGQVAISARSRSKINVQRIMEDLGGGGHFNLAACQIDGETIEQVREILVTKIRSDYQYKES
ncbi:DHH family phosphoesterase [Streptococcus porcorum]|uniref:Cyclic-di-AMP phosphodiesterase n=1 Tax=Streptococcus porcorum TaxID=701526 RepID=A0ABV2JF79_9STRE